MNLVDVRSPDETYNCDNFVVVSGLVFHPCLTLMTLKITVTSAVDNGDAITALNNA